MVPEEWELVKLCELAAKQPSSFVNGPFGSNLLTSELRNSGIPVIYIRDIKDGFYQPKETVYVDETKANELSACEVLSGDILITKVGDPPAIASIYPNGVGRAIVTQDVIRLRVDENKCVANFVRGVINSPLGRRLVEDISIKGTRTRVSLGDFKKILVPLPPLPEQKKIAEILGSVDEAIASTQAVIDQTRKVKQGLLQQLLTKGIGHTKFKESSIGIIPESWDVSTAGEVCELITKGTTPRDGNFSRDSGDIPYLRVQNLTFNGKLNFSENPAFISRETHLGELKRSRTLPGDVLINIVGPPLGKVSVVSSEYQEWNINQAIAVFRVSSHYNKKFLAYWLQIPQVLKWFISRSKKTTSQQNLTLQLCKDLPVPLPPLFEQVEIIKRLEAIDFQISKENEFFLALMTIKRGLMQDLLTGKVRVKQTSLT